MRDPQAFPDNLAAKINGLVGLSLVQLRAAWVEEFRKAPPKILSRDLLVRTLAWHLQEKTFGGHDRETEKLLNSLARGKADPGIRRLKAGIREFGDWSIAELKDQVGPGRRYLVWTLDALSWEPSVFKDTMWFLLRLAASENESWGNNATGEFVQRFRVQLELGGRSAITA